MEATLEAGLCVPDDIAFIGCGNMRYNDYLKVPLSSIDHGTTELGRIAGELALELVANPEQPPKSILVPPTLVARASNASCERAFHTGGIGRLPCKLAAPIFRERTVTVSKVRVLCRTRKRRVSSLHPMANVKTGRSADLTLPGGRSTT